MSNLTPQLRADKTGKLVTRHVKTDAGSADKTKSIPSPSLAAAPKKKRPYKPTERQLGNVTFGVPMHTDNDAMWNNLPNRPTSPELLALPMTASQQVAFRGDYYRFNANEAQYYDVMSVVRPWDAINLLHRGIHSADEARAYLSEHGLDHLAGDHSRYTDVLLRSKINVNISASCLDKIIDADADPKNALEWVKTNAMPTLTDEAYEIGDEMLSGELTISDLKSIGVRYIAPNLKAVAQALIHAKNDNNPDFTVDDIRTIMENAVEDIRQEKASHWRTISDENIAVDVEARLNICRFHGWKVALRYLSVESYLWRREQIQLSGGVNERELAEYTRYSSQLGGGWGTSSLYNERVLDLQRSGVPVEKARSYVARATNLDECMKMLDAAKADVAPAVLDGWL